MAFFGLVVKEMEDIIAKYPWSAYAYEERSKKNKVTYYPGPVIKHEYGSKDGWLVHPLVLITYGAVALGACGYLAFRGNSL